MRVPLADGAFLYFVGDEGDRYAEAGVCDGDAYTGVRLTTSAPARGGGEGGDPTLPRGCKTSCPAEEGRAIVGPKCRGAGNCAGTLELTAVWRVDGKRKTVELGSADFSIARGESARVVVS